MLDDIPPTYITVKYKGKMRLKRRFGACHVQDCNGKPTRQLCPSEYLFVLHKGKKMKFVREI